MDATLAQLQEKLTGSVLDLSAIGMQSRPPGRWSIQQIMEHLMLTYDATETVLRDRLAKGRPTRTRPTFSQRCGRVIVMRLGHIPSGREAPTAVTPADSLTARPGDQIASAVTERLETLDNLLDETARVFGKERRSVNHIILGPLKPAEWRRFHVLHGLHHLRQIEAIRTGYANPR